MFQQGPIFPLSWYVSESLQRELNVYKYVHIVYSWRYVRVTGGMCLSLTLYPGGFMQWDASLYNATDLVSHSAELKAPIVYVSFNYRLGGILFFSRIS